MVCSRYPHLTAAAVAAFMITTLPGCSDREPTSSASESETGSTSDTGTSTSPGTTTDETTAGPGSDTDSTSDTTSETTDPTTGQDFLTTGPETETDTDSTNTGGPQPNGAQCEADSECESGNCYIIPMLIGVCSECNEDSDCPMDKASCSLDFLAMQATCVAPEPGAQCESTETCMAGGEELYCEPLLPGVLGGLLPSTCGECSDDSDCEDGQLCNQNLDLTGFAGYYECIDPGTVDNNAFCNTNEACTSGHCNDTEFEGLPLPLSLGICGECASDGDCMGNSTCVPGSLSMGGAMGSTCQ